MAYSLSLPPLSRRRAKHIGRALYCTEMSRGVVFQLDLQLFSPRNVRARVRFESFCVGRCDARYVGRPPHAKHACALCDRVGCCYAYLILHAPMLTCYKATRSHVAATLLLLRLRLRLRQPGQGYLYARAAPWAQCCYCVRVRAMVACA